MKASVTFEYETRQPDTWKGDIGEGSPSGATSRAVRVAKKALSPRGWMSIVVVLNRQEVVDTPKEPA